MSSQHEKWRGIGFKAREDVPLVSGLAIDAISPNAKSNTLMLDASFKV